MLSLYKDLRIGFCLTAIVGAILAVMIILGTDMNLFLIYLFEVLWILGCNYLFTFVAVRRVNAILSLMNNQCNISEYLTRMLALFGNAKGENLKMFMSVNLSAGYLSLGDADTALFHLQSVPIDENKMQKRKNALMLTYYNNYALAGILKNDDKTACEMLEKMRRHLDCSKLKPKAKQQFESNYQLKRVRLNMRQGNYAGVEEYCVGLLQNSRILLQQVSLCDILRDVYLHEGRTQEAEKCREFILQYGGDTYYAAKANAS